MPKPIELLGEPGRLALVVPDRPVSITAGDPLPQRWQDEIHLSPGKRDADVIHKARRLIERPNRHAERLFAQERPALPASLPLVDPSEGAHGGNRVSPVTRSGPLTRPAQRGRPGRCYRASERPFDDEITHVGAS